MNQYNELDQRACVWITRCLAGHIKPTPEQFERTIIYLRDRLGFEPIAASPNQKPDTNDTKELSERLFNVITNSGIYTRPQLDRVKPGVNSIKAMDRVLRNQFNGDKALAISVIDFIADDEFWIQQVRSATGLKKHADTLIAKVRSKQRKDNADAIDTASEAKETAARNGKKTEWVEVKDEKGRTVMREVKIELDKKERGTTKSTSEIVKEVFDE